MKHIADIQEVKLEIVAKAVEDNNLQLLNDVGFFKNIRQIERARRLHTTDRIWIGRMLKLVYGNNAPNPNKVAIFQKPNQFKEVRNYVRNGKK